MPRFAEKYAAFFTAEYLMGPNSVYLLDALLAKYPLHLDRRAAVLDLGCGKGLTSLCLARETGATVYANDLWISGEENAARFDAWAVGDRVLPSHEDATHLSFAPETFDAIVSIDAYHYFAGEAGFFRDKLLPFVKPGGMALIAVPGMKGAYEGRQDELLGVWLGEEARLFRSAEAWRDLIGDAPDIANVDVWELDCFSQAWDTWLAVDSDYARGDSAHFDAIRRFTCFVGMAVKKRG